MTGCCPAHGLLDSVYSLSNRTNADGDDIESDIEIYLDKKLVSGDTVNACPRCFAKCALYRSIDRKMAENSVATLDLPDVNVGYVAIESSGGSKYLGVESNNQQYLVVMNLNDANFAKDRIFLVKNDDTMAWTRELDDAAVDQWTNGNPETDAVKIVELELKKAYFNKIKVPANYIDVLKEGAGILTLRNIIIFIVGYYVLGTASVLIYFNFFKKTKNHTRTE